MTQDTGMAAICRRPGPLGVKFVVTCAGKGGEWSEPVQGGKSGGGVWHYHDNNYFMMT